MKLFVVICVFVAYTESVKLPSNFKTCNRKQPDFQKCLLEAAQYGITQLKRPYKQLKLPNLEPLVISKLVASLETPLVNVSSVLTNCKFSGLTETKLQKFEFDFEKKCISLIGTFPQLKSACDYVIDGRILVLPMKGEGSSSATFKNFHWTFDLIYDEVRKNNKTYVKPISSKFDGKPEVIAFDFNDLFDGDQELGKRANQLVNDNWSVLYDEAKDTYLENAKNFWLQLTTGLFNRVSLEEAFDN